jgi:hypothetical protein
MKIQRFLEHHGIARNPFAEEDAQSDPVFKDFCINDAFHPAWDKIYGEPQDPSTSIVFGEKGAGKTAMRLQIARHLDEFNRKHSHAQSFVIHYDDFNPFIDRFVNRLPARRRRIDRALTNWRLWDHMDAILSLAITDLINRVLETHRPPTAPKMTAEQLDQLDRHQRRDMLLLAACYDQSTEQPMVDRWKRLARRLKFWTLKAQIPFWVGVVVTLLVIYAAAVLLVSDENENLVRLSEQIPIWLYPLAMLIGWLPWLWKLVSRFAAALGVRRGLRVLNRPVGPLTKILLRFTGGELAGQPLPNQNRTDDRYELFTKLQGLLQSLGFGGVFVLVDRVDEPYLINGSAELMKALIWPMLDNKFLKHPGLGVKIMLPAELNYYIEREGREFSQRARLDKQNLVPSLAWTGEALFDVANARLRACAADGRSPNVRDLFEPAVTHERLLDAFRGLRVPRHLHKFLYQLLVAHCNAHTEEDPEWKISKDRFESALALYERDMGREI